MTFPVELLQLLIWAAVTGTGLGAIVLLALLVRDFYDRNIW